jgi:hypothetical protein
MKKIFKEKNFNNFVWAPLSSRVNIYIKQGLPHGPGCWSLVKDSWWWLEDSRRTIWSLQRLLVVQYASAILTSVFPVHQKRENHLKPAADLLVLLPMQQQQPGLQQPYQQLIQAWIFQQKQLQQ